MHIIYKAPNNKRKQTTEDPAIIPTNSMVSSVKSNNRDFISIVYIAMVYDIC